MRSSIYFTAALIATAVSVSGCDWIPGFTTIKADIKSLKEQDAEHTKGIEESMQKSWKVANYVIEMDKKYAQSISRLDGSAGDQISQIPVEEEEFPLLPRAENLSNGTGGNGNGNARRQNGSSGNGNGGRNRQRYHPMVVERFNHYEGRISAGEAEISNLKDQSTRREDRVEGRLNSYAERITRGETHMTNVSAQQASTNAAIADLQGKVANIAQQTQWLRARHDEYDSKFATKQSVEDLQQSISSNHQEVIGRFSELGQMMQRQAVSGESPSRRRSTEPQSTRSSPVQKFQSYEANDVTRVLSGHGNPPPNGYYDRTVSRRRS